MAPPLSPQAKRWRMIIVTLPIIGATSFVLFKRLVLGEERRKLKPNEEILPLNPYKHNIEAYGDAGKEVSSS